MSRGWLRPATRLVHLPPALRCSVYGIQAANAAVLREMCTDAAGGGRRSSCTVRGWQRSELPAPTVMTADKPRWISSLPSQLPDSMVHLKSGLRYQDTQVGDGPEAFTGALITVQYTTVWSVQGKTLKKSEAVLQAPIEFELTAGHTSEGLCEAIAGMKVGGTRLLVMPTKLTAGALGRSDPAPDKAELVVQVKLLGVKVPPAEAEPHAETAAASHRLGHLFGRNRIWADAVRARDPEFFQTLSLQQSPEYLWIGCSDSRVPANQIVSLLPGEIFVHRNIANVVVHTDLNCLSVIQFAVDMLKVKHIIVCGHYGCSGVRAAHLRSRVGLADNWIRHVVDVDEKHKSCVHSAHGVNARTDILCELNVIEQVNNVCRTTIVRDTWERGQALTVHGWIYGLHDGLLRDLGMEVSSAAELDTQYTAAIASVRANAERGAQRPPPFQEVE